MSLLRSLPDDHDCAKEGCIGDSGHYENGLCAICGGCFDPECCIHDDECYPPYADV